MVRMKVFYKGKSIVVDVKKVGFWGIARGLMFRTRRADNLLFDNFNGAIHSWFVFFPFLAIWLDGKNNAVDLKIVKPFETYIKSEIKFSKLVEMPLNSRNRKIIERLTE